MKCIMLQGGLRLELGPPFLNLNKISELSSTQYLIVLFIKLPMLSRIFELSSGLDF